MARFSIAILFLTLFCAELVVAQTLKVGTVTRPPFSYEENGVHSGFSIEFWNEIGDRIGVETEFQRHTQFGTMLSSVESGATDAAIANISITASREEIMDFTHPIFESGLQVMVPATDGDFNYFWRAIISTDLAIALILAFALLFGGGMLMWSLERRAQPYFDLPLKHALFPSFWWALNLVVNGGFEERQPRSFFGRIFAVILVVSSLFVVSVFVARITAVMTVEAISHNIHSINDLYGRHVGTINGSTAASFLEKRDIQFLGFEDIETLTQRFEAGALDAVVFDAPVLAYYVQTGGKGIAELAGPMFLQENYGIALPTDSTYLETINRAILLMKEDGTYARLHTKWFGSLN